MITLSLYQLRIPFRVAFSHASAIRSETQSLWVEARSSDGTVGFGESCPREYVTGESIESAAKFFAAHEVAILAHIRDATSLRAWVNAHRVEIDRNPAAWCAIELALLDLFAKRENVSVEHYLGLPELAGSFRYTAVLGDSEIAAFKQQAEKYKAAGFKDYKVKASGKLDHDRAKLVTLSAIGAKRVRLDANNLWKDAQQAIEFLRQLDYPFFAVEEPIQAGDYDGMAKLAQSLNVKIILDESFTRAQQFESIRAHPSSWIVNIRVSKMGGLLRALEIVEQAKALDVPVVIGAQVGETSLLTRAALTVAAHAGSALAAQEGAFGTLLLSEDVCAKPLMFGAGGILSWPSAAGRTKGFGLSINRPSGFLHRC